MCRLAGQTAETISRAATKGSLQRGPLSRWFAISWGNLLTGGFVPGTGHLEKQKVKGLCEHNHCCQCTGCKCTQPRWRPGKPFLGRSSSGSCSLLSILVFIPVSHFSVTHWKNYLIFCSSDSPTYHTSSKFSLMPSFCSTLLHLRGSLHSFFHQLFYYCSQVAPTMF